MLRLRMFSYWLFLSGAHPYTQFFSHSIRTYGGGPGGMIPYLKFNILGDYNFDGELVLLLVLYSL